MNITLVMVTTLDGKSTKGDSTGTSPWASAEDQTVFQDLIASHDCIVMGSVTYLSVRDFIKPSVDKLRIILTRDTEKFVADASREGLVFTSENPQELAQRLAKEDYEQVLLVGGAETNSRFFDVGLVQDIFVTIEPLLFGSGSPLVGSLHKDVQLQLISHEQLNEQGTLLLHYSVTNTNKESNL